MMRFRETFGLAFFVLSFGMAQGADWGAINACARAHARIPIRPGEPGERPFWNGRSRMFLHPPAFDFKPVDGAISYRFALTREDDGTSVTWMAEHPWAGVPGDIWDSQSPGAVLLKVEGVDESGRVLGDTGERTFWRAACFRGPYAYANCSYGFSAKRCHWAVYSLPYVRAWETATEPPEGYDLYCYPAKILSAMIRSLVRCERDASVEKGAAFRIARKMADWMIAHSQPEGAPLAHFPPTYWGDRRNEAVRCRGLNMLSYPACAAEAYLELAEATGETRYREAAVAIARTYLRLQGEDGTWPLLVRESDGASVRANRLLPVGKLPDVLVRVGALTGEKAFGKAAERAFGYVLRGPCATWNWDAQFEDQDPKPPYENLQKGDAVRAAIALFARGRVAEGCEIIDWCEDQFVVWSDPLHHQRWREWRLPVALEQYNYYKPIDASIADMISGFTAAWKATGDRLYLEKARALADNLVCNQRRKGTFPTYFDGHDGSDWVNCMVWSALALETFDEAVREADRPPAPERLAIWPEGRMPSVQTNQTYAPYLEWYEPKVRRSKTVVISVSGGGYYGSGNDGFEVTPIRNYLLDKGVTVVAMRYRAPRPVGLQKHLTAWQDAQRAVRVVRREAVRRGLDPDRIGFTGCSAGGHLAVMAAVSSTVPSYPRIDDLDDTPCNVNFAIPVYPAYLLAPEAENGDVEGCDNLSAAFCPEFAFDAQTPPMCLIHGDEDGWSPMGSVRVYHKLRTMKIPAELHVMSGENHCFMEHPKAGTPAATWKDRVWEWMVKSGYSD